MSVILIKITVTNQDYILKFKEFNDNEIINEVISFKKCYLFAQKTDLNYTEIINQENLINFTVFHNHKKMGFSKLI